VAERLIAGLGGTTDREVPFPELTVREREILERIAQGHSNGAIATRLGLAPKTVGNHISAIFAKLRVATRAEVIVRARQGGLGRDGATSDRQGDSGPG
jgi:DNA-binding NarL/FixJ family response regulator